MPQPKIFNKNTTQIFSNNAPPPQIFNNIALQIFSNNAPPIQLFKKSAPPDIKQLLSP